MRNATIASMALAATLVLMTATLVMAITLGQFGDFEDGSLEGWNIGSAGTADFPPTNIPDGGPGGAGDNYLQYSSDGNGAGGKMAIYSEDPVWTGDYQAAGVQGLRMDLNNLGAVPLDLRVMIAPSANAFTNPSCYSSTALSLPAASGWVTHVFSLDAADVTHGFGFCDYANTITNVQKVWLYHSPTGQPPNFEAPMVASLGIDNILAVDQSVLPVELASFDARADGDAAELAWTTASETNNAGFAVEHRADDATWTTRGFVEGYGTTASAQAYRFRVDALAPGTHAFRLKQSDFDGTATYSPLVEVNVAVPGAYVLSEAYPNPFNPSTQFTLAVAQRQSVRVAVFDGLGREVALLHQGVLDADTAHRFQFDAAGLPSGTYLIRATGEAFTETRTVSLMK